MSPSAKTSVAREGRSPRSSAAIATIGPAVILSYLSAGIVVFEGDAEPPRARHQAVVQQ